MVKFDEAATLGVHICEILLPKKEVEIEKWAVVACDQYTSQPEYWLSVENMVGEAYSTLNLIFPEIYLEGSDEDQGRDKINKRIEKINNAMKDYLEKNILVSEESGVIYIDRKTSGSGSRKGLIFAVDLEKYNYTKGSQTLIRATEGTVIERLPPRIKVRENAMLELPHVMLLIDDPQKTVIEPIAQAVELGECSDSKLYDFDLMMGGGHIKGYKIDQHRHISNMIDALKNLANPDNFAFKYGVSGDKGVLLFAVGDGNHSLASAKGHWENVKKTLSKDEINEHPARFALVEVVNVHDEGLNFEPIHRVVFNVDFKDLLDNMISYYDDVNKNKGNNYYLIFESKKDMLLELDKISGSGTHHIISFVTKENYGFIAIGNPRNNLEVGTLQTFLDVYSKMDGKVKIDYIHGEDVVDSLGSKDGNMGFYLPAMHKNDLFKTVILDGALPRKTFSMGEAEEKRFYLECRKITVG